MRVLAFQARMRSHEAALVRTYCGVGSENPDRELEAVQRVVVTKDEIKRKRS